MIDAILELDATAISRVWKPTASLSVRLDAASGFRRGDRVELQITTTPGIILRGSVDSVDGRLLYLNEITLVRNAVARNTIKQIGAVRLFGIQIPWEAP